MNDSLKICILIMENSIYKIAFVGDMLFDLCINKTMMLSSGKPITTEDKDWFELRLVEADIRVREIISFLLCDQEDDEKLCFSLFKKHKLHAMILPIKIENAIVAIICSKWYIENGETSTFSEIEAINELHSLALKQSDKYIRKSNY